MYLVRFSVVLSVAFLALSGFSFVYAETSKRAPVPAPVATGPERVETTTYNSWTVTCQESLGIPSKKSCSALLRVIDQNHQLLMAWLIGLDPNGKLTSVIRIPTGVTLTDKASGAKATGILVKNGLDLKLGTAVHHLTFVACEPQWCEASGGMDDRFVKDALGATDAVVTIYAVDGRAIGYPSLPLKGVDKAILLVRH